MKAVVVTKSAGPEGLELQQVPEPVPQKNEVLVRVEAVGVNFADVIGAMGSIPVARSLLTFVDVNFPVPSRAPAIE